LKFKNIIRELIEHRIIFLKSLDDLPNFQHENIIDGIIKEYLREDSKIELDEII
jgi:hypothetical protein